MHMIPFAALYNVKRSIIAKNKKTERQYKKYKMS